MPGDAFHLGVDVGGTFTDLILFDENASQIYVHKLPSTPADPAVAIAQGVREVCALAGTEPSGLSELLHGTTVGTNTILERSGARVGMVTTEGFRDILHIARHRKPYNFSIMQDIPQQSRPLVLRQLRRCVTERTLTDGTVLTPLDEESVQRELRYSAHSPTQRTSACSSERQSSCVRPRSSRCRAKSLRSTASMSASQRRRSTPTLGLAWPDT
jgi:N-methylhydantoinase A/oxoprolinase/acetone carboxylase beta subunit